MPSLAVERLILKVGPFEGVIPVTDLEQFARKGELSPALQPYAPFLQTPQVRQLLTNRLQLDPRLGSQVVDDLLKTPGGEQLINSLQRAVPDLSPDALRAGLTIAARQANGLDAIAVLRAIPQETVTLNVTEALGVASQINLPYWQTQAIGPLLERDLAVNGPPLQTNLDPAAPGSANIQQQTLSLRDTRRNRVILADLYWSDANQGPLVVMIPGLEANRSFLAYLARHLASHGLTVVSMEHPSVRVGRSTPPANLEELVPATEFVDRPQDVRFVLDELARLNQQPGSLQNKLNTRQVSLIGHSLGGYTALALVGAELDLDSLRQFCRNTSPLQRTPADWLQCAATGLAQRQLTLRDDRIQQAVVLNPVAGSIFGRKGLAQVAVPTLMLASTSDTLTPALSQQFQPFTQLPKPKYLITAIGATHLSISDPTNFSGALAQTTLVPERRGQEVEPLRRLIRGTSLAFIQQLTPEASRYTPFLTPAYAQLLSASPLTLRFSTELPSSINRWLGFVSLL